MTLIEASKKTAVFSVKPSIKDIKHEVTKCASGAYSESLPSSPFIKGSMFS